VLYKVIEQSSLHRPKLRTESIKQVIQLYDINPNGCKLSATQAERDFKVNMEKNIFAPVFYLNAFVFTSDFRPALPNGSALAAFALMMCLFAAPCDAYQDFNLGAIDDHGGFPLFGAASGDWTGCSVGSAGDVNGDGIVDIIIGAYLATPAITPARSQAGVSYVYFGRPDVS